MSGDILNMGIIILITMNKSSRVYKCVQRTPSSISSVLNSTFITVKVPKSLDAQRAIGRYLDSIDTKIEINRRINR